MSRSHRSALEKAFFFHGGCILIIMSNYFLQMRRKGREEEELQDSFHSQLQFTFILFHQKNSAKKKNIQRNEMK